MPFSSLSAGDQKFVADAWKPIKADLQGAANAVFYTYLKKFPSNQDKFETLKGKPIDEVKETANFKTIAGRVFGIFDNLVANVGNDKAFQKIVVDMAGPHVTRPISQGSYNDLRTVVFEAMALDATRKI